MAEGQRMSGRENRRGGWSPDLLPLVAAGGQGARRGRHRPRLQLPQRLLRVGGRAARGGGLAVYALDLRGRGQSDGERFYVDIVRGLRRRRATLVANLAKSREPGLPVFLLGHSAGGVISCVYALEHQAELAGLICESFAFQVPAPDFALAVAQGAEPPRAARPRAAPQERGLLPRSRGGAGHERRSADRPRGPAHPDRGRDGPRRRAAQAGVPAHHAAGADPARHRRQGHQAERQPALLRQRRLARQDVEALRGARPRPAQRPRQGEGDGRHQGLDRRAPPRG